jgi:hypothetical protein
MQRQIWLNLGGLGMLMLCLRSCIGSIRGKDRVTRSCVDAIKERGYRSV